MRPDAVRRLGLAALLMAGGVGVALWASAPFSSDFGYDVDAYLEAATRLRQSLPLYPLAGLAAITPGPHGHGEFFNAPLVAVAFLPLEMLPRELAHFTWFAGLSALALGLIVHLARMHPAATRPWALAAGLAFLPLISELRYGNLNLVSLVLVLLAWHMRARLIPAGAVLAVAIVLKLIPLLVLPFLIVGRWRLVAVTLAAVAVLVVATLPWLPGAWADYAAVVRAIGLGIPAGTSNIVPGSLGEAPFRYALPIGAVGMALWAGWVVRGRPPAEETGFLLALAAAPLLATTVWYTYLVFALPLLLAPRPATAGSRGAAAATSVDRLGRIAGYLAMEGRLTPLPLLGVAFAVASGAARLRAASLPEAPP